MVKTYVGFTNVQTLFGFPTYRLNDTRAFHGFFGFNQNEWVRTESLTPILQKYFPGCDMCSVKDQARSAKPAYADWRKYVRAVEAITVSPHHFIEDGPIKATCSTSFYVPNGPAYVGQVMRQRQEEGQRRGWLVRSMK